MKKLLTLIMTFSTVIATTACTKNDEPINTNGTTTITIIIGDKTFDATIDNTPTGSAFLALLPTTLQMNELNGNEKYCYISTDLPTDAFYPETINAGDLLLYGNSCVVLFYETFGTSYSYSRIGRITDPAGLQEAVGSGNVSVTFRLNGTAGLKESKTNTLKSDSPTYNINGQRVPDNYHGIIIRNGEKILQQ